MSTAERRQRNTERAFSLDWSERALSTAERCEPAGGAPVPHSRAALFALLAAVCWVISAAVLPATHAVGFVLRSLLQSSAFKVLTIPLAWSAIHFLCADRTEFLL